MNFLQKLSWIYYRYFTNRITFARYLGVKIGDNCFLGACEWNSEPYLIEIGNHVQVTDHVCFHTHGGAHVARQKYPNFDIFGKIKIEDWAYIGSGTHIMPGVTIGKGSLIAAGSVVTKSVPDGEVWGGCPAKKLSTVNEYIEKNSKYNVKTKGLNYKTKKSILQSLPEEMFIKK